jgi:hypothetical protein
VYLGFRIQIKPKKATDYMTFFEVEITICYCPTGKFTLKPYMKEKICRRENKPCERISY